jgi:bifunctional UDP-N-acetylglucosamine pyrophosphorylase/glucosamine-1-phosphate N-acetyltransferase
MSLWPLPQEKSALFAAGRTLAHWEKQLGQSLPLSYPWDLLELNQQLLAHLDAWPGHPAAQLLEGACLQVGEGTTILPGVIISGRVVIGKHCMIGPNCYLRGDTSIGDHCHVGHAVEIKNSILAPRTAVGHLSYVGDSYLDREVNLGGGTITANFRHDGGLHRSKVGSTLVPTGREKLGAIIGRGVHTGINTAIYPGRKLGPGTTTRPGETVSRDLVR